MSTAVVERQLADDYAVSPVNGLDSCHDPTERNDTSDIRVRLPTDLWKTQMPGDLRRKAGRDSGTTTGEQPDDAQANEQFKQQCGRH
jgi:hypothetical protein